MLIANKQTANNLIINTNGIKENLTYTTFEISNRNTYEKWVFSCDDWSGSDYFFAFTMSIYSSPETFTSSVSLDLDAGEYQYTLWKMPDAYNLNIASASEMLSIGIMKVVGTYSPFISVDDDFTFISPEN